MFTLHGNSCFAHLIFLTAIWLTHNQLWATGKGGSLTNLILITVFDLLWPKGHWEPCNQVGSQSMTEHLVGIELGAFQFWMKCLNPLEYQAILLPLVVNTVFELTNPMCTVIFAFEAWLAKFCCKCYLQSHWSYMHKYMNNW